MEATRVRRTRAVRTALGAARSEITRAILGPGLPLCAIIMAYSLLQPMWEFMQGGPNPDFLHSIFQVFELSIEQGAMRPAKYVAYACVYATAFAQDREHCFDRALLMRSGRGAYEFAKIAATWVSAGLAVALGLALTIGILLAKGFPMVDWRLSALKELYISGACLLAEGRLLEQWLLIWFSYAVSAATMATCALAVSAYTDNRFVILLAPLVFYYPFNFLTNYVLPLDDWLKTPYSFYVSLDYLGGGVTPFRNPQEALKYLLGLHVPLILTFCIAFIAGANRRLRR